jgi:lipopolysaccharide/colanic/teichoic acid biosynthesis glycosyltransferase
MRVASSHYLISKRAIDIAFASAGALMLSPLILLTALLVAIDVGLALIFRQARPGRDGRPIVIYKFRTMRPAFTADGRRIPEVRRISSIGRFLRASRLDELPQLLNILKGDMSLVGPRPLLSEDQPEDDALRLHVRPGLTGWAQINGGRIISSAEKANLDTWYVRNASLGLDIKILVRTACMVMTNSIDGARAHAAEDRRFLSAQDGPVNQTLSGDRRLFG